MLSKLARITKINWKNSRFGQNNILVTTTKNDNYVAFFDIEFKNIIKQCFENGSVIIIKRYNSFSNDREEWYFERIASCVDVISLK